MSKHNVKVYNNNWNCFATMCPEGPKEIGIKFAITRAAMPWDCCRALRSTPEVSIYPHTLDIMTV